MAFTYEEVIAEAKRRLNGQRLCIDCVEDAMDNETLDDAVMHVLLDSVMWNSPQGNPMDEKLWEKILPEQGA